ncbi:PREDICTED: probable phosphorylase b kinase regulatory subunit alpha isoform X2 [Priapulus caudatus]|uniref:Phosphorylase b kinase regulatory subunit n=1 Tax=Priapulus caudatus TaxID=37621 RepID=A0ABM1F8K9_PRICU|nr:PREDICTED: probable phosphorylase b kinase regulatory subunit alpha isoform X2 [Priapulus caudatus]
MRSRSNSGVRLDYYQHLLHNTILCHQHPVTGLLPASPNQPHAWVRDNVYAAMSIWSLAMAYKKNADLDEDRAKGYELDQSVVKIMRGLLMCMMNQVEKLEKFKYSQSPRDALHAKYSSADYKTVVGDGEWGHLQIDATSLYLLQLSQMTASGLQIIFTLDEVSFIQNLVFYIEAAYRIPDYGIWERGDKTNHGLPELNASSIGMAKAALESINDLDVFGARGGPASVIHVMADEAQHCQAVLASMLPRESNSKEIDAALLSIVGFPAFAVEDPELVQMTKEAILSKLQGRYGCKRFLRDGHKTAREDPSRLHYEPWELHIFENIECEWPLFYIYLSLDGLFRGNLEQAEEYFEALEDIMIKTENGLKLLPEMYAVPPDKVEEEKKNPHSQERIAVGKIPQMWGQSLYILNCLLKEGFIAVGELDPMNRRLITDKKPDLVVQVVILAETKNIQEKLREYDFDVETVAEVRPIEVHPARVLSEIFAQLGKNRKLSLSGRPSHDVGLLSTSKLYMLRDRIFTFTPQFSDPHEFYLAADANLLLDMFLTDIAFLKTSWRQLGRPTITIVLHKHMWGDIDLKKSLPPAVIATLKKLKSGYVTGASSCRVDLRKIKDFLSTSCVTQLNFLANTESGDIEGTDESVLELLDKITRQNGSHRHARLPVHQGRTPGSMCHRASSVRGIVKRTKSIALDQGDEANYMRSRYAARQPSFSATREQDSIDDDDCNVSIQLFNDSTGSRRRSSELNYPHLDSHHMKPPLPPDRSSYCLRTEPIAQPTAQVHVERMETLYSGINPEDLLDILREAASLTEQADIIHYLFITKGASWDTHIDGKPGCKVKDLLQELYEKACHEKHWWLVRHTAGVLKKQVEDLAKAVTDLLVRQKQVTVGMPPEPRERTITRPLPPDELRGIIADAYGEDSSTSMLTQELLIYLAMFICTEPDLFRSMLRLRVGLIIQVMASELARTLNCDGDKAAEDLLNLSPYELKTLLHHILSGKELRVHVNVEADNDNEVSLKESNKEENLGMRQVRDEINDTHKVSFVSFGSSKKSGSGLSEGDICRQGQWLRRRRLDGALNRVPYEFYPKLWKVLEKCHGLSIQGMVLPQSLTREMTPGETKFALQVEAVLNRIPQPEYRQLMVETLMVLTLAVEADKKCSLGGIIQVEYLVSEANRIFLAEQLRVQGDATLCCAGPHATVPLPGKPPVLRCGGKAGICQLFYDSAPSGRFGTMTYLCKAVAQSLNIFPATGDLECVIS